MDSNTYTKWAHKNKVDTKWAFYLQCTQIRLTNTKVGLQIQSGPWQTQNGLTCT